MCAGAQTGGGNRCILNPEASLARRRLLGRRIPGGAVGCRRGRALDGRILSSGPPTGPGIYFSATGFPAVSNKEAKKRALLTPKEQKAAKPAKKHSGDVVPMIPR